MRKQSIQLGNGYFTGTLHNNAANRAKQGAGFNPLSHVAFREQNIFRDDAVGLNFEHVMNGAVKDAGICMFTPRLDTCSILRHGDFSASIVHDAQESSWNIDSEMRYAFSGENCIDLIFKVTPREDRFPLGYIAFMWASYMNSAIDRRIHFWGRDGQQERWVTFGEETAEDFERGTIACSGVRDLAYENGTKTLNIIEHPDKKFVLPFYYGLVNGSGREDSQDDPMVYIMMFDQRESIRFAMWNFIENAQGVPDTHCPAWDWQYVIRNPQIDQEYGYRARVIYKPFAGRADVKTEYENWVAGMDSEWRAA